MIGSVLTEGYHGRLCSDGGDTTVGSVLTEGYTVGSFMTEGYHGTLCSR